MRLRFLAVLVALVSVSACSSQVTEQQYIDHAMKFSSGMTTPEQKARTRKLFVCMWPAVQKNQDLLDQFMAADHSDRGPLSAELSKLMVACMKVGLTPPVSTTEAPPTTVG
jgi:hypothetical protein